MNRRRHFERTQEVHRVGSLFLFFGCAARIILGLPTVLSAESQALKPSPSKLRRKSRYVRGVFGNSGTVTIGKV